MSLLDVCVQAGFCQIRSQLTIQERSRDPHNILECWKCAFFSQMGCQCLVFVIPVVFSDDCVSGLV